MLEKKIYRTIKVLKSILKSEVNFTLVPALHKSPKLAIVISVTLVVMTGLFEFSHAQDDFVSLKESAVNEEDMIYIEGGIFTMGSSADEPGHEIDEEPPHLVKVNSFSIGRFEVTNKEYQRFILETGHPSPYVDEDWAKPFNWFENSYPEGSSRTPVVLIRWDDAVAYCAWLSGQTNETYRLPSEAEWEYACRAGSTTAFSFGDNEDEIESYAWYDGNSNGRMHTVGLKKPNAWALYDMHGNVWEWCQDWYRENYTDTPTDGSAHESPKGSYRVYRGGSWHFYARSCRSANRYGLSPSNTLPNLGFRVVRSEPEK